MKFVFFFISFHPPTEGGMFLLFWIFHQLQNKNHGESNENKN